jgi:hypothetical protein
MLLADQEVQEPGLVVPFPCKSTYTSPAKGDKVELTADNEVAPIADATTSSAYVGEVETISPDDTEVRVRTPFRKVITVSSYAAIASPGLGVWVGQKVRLYNDGVDVSGLAIASRMMILETATGADEDVHIGLY